MAPRLQCTASVTFEFETRPPLTLRITEPLAANSVETIVFRAARQARLALEPRVWRSLVVVLERVADPSQASQDAPGEEEEG